jgi:phosphate-binding protein
MKMKMKIKKHHLFPLLVLLAACGSPNRDKKEDQALSKRKNIVLKGSDTVLPLGQKEAEVFMKKNTDFSVTVVGGGSGVGISSLMDGTTDIAMSSRPLKMDEKLKMENKSIVPVETIIAYDALAVVVHPSNPVSKLTREQITDIFTGKITNWKEVGGKDLKIIAYSRGIQFGHL